MQGVCLPHVVLIVQGLSCPSPHLVCLPHVLLVVQGFSWPHHNLLLHAAVAQPGGPLARAYCAVQRAFGADALRLAGRRVDLRHGSGLLLLLLLLQVVAGGGVRNGRVATLLFGSRSRCCACSCACSCCCACCCGCCCGCGCGGDSASAGAALRLRGVQARRAATPVGGGVIGPQQLGRPKLLAWCV
eukprot:366064-Chlamydomonas_euryale.AAC.6